MTGFEAKLGPISEAYAVKQAEEKAADDARRAALPPREFQKIDIPKDPNAAFAATLEYSPAPELPTEEELQASWEKYLAMPPEDIYELKDPAGMLFEACQHLRDEHVKLLIERGSPTNYADPLYSYTPLHIAAFNGREKAVAYLLDAGASTTAKDIDGKIPYELARANCHELARQLLEMATPAEAIPEVEEDDDKH